MRKRKRRGDRGKEKWRKRETERNKISRKKETERDKNRDWDILKEIITERPT